MMGPDYDHFCALALDRSGLVLGPAKAYLVQSRLDPLARSVGLSDVAALLAKLRTSPNETLISACVDAMATHESLFFRDSAPFEQLASVVLPQLHAARPAGRPLRIWSAACSGGQEPYSIAMVVQECAHLLAGRRVEIFATDITEKILTKARVGIYSEFEVNRGLSPERRARWMEAQGGNWAVSNTLKTMVEFKAHNLLDPLPPAAPFDVVFCRNVLIYFDVDGKTRALDRIAKVLAPDGTLFLGSAESVLGLKVAFEAIGGSRGRYGFKGSQGPAAVALAG